MVQKHGFLGCTSRLYICNATQGARGDFHRKLHRFDCQFGSDAARACNRVLHQAQGPNLRARQGMISDNPTKLCEYSPFSFLNRPGATSSDSTAPMSNSALTPTPE